MTGCTTVLELGDETFNDLQSMLNLALWTGGVVFSQEGPRPLEVLAEGGSGFLARKCLSPKGPQEDVRKDRG